MKPFLDTFGFVGSAGQSPVAFPCSFAVSLPVTASILAMGGGTTGAPGTPDLLASSDSGASATDNVTSDTTPTFRVALPPQALAGNTVRLYRAGSVEIGSELLDAGDISAGFVDVTASPALTAAGHTVTARIENGAGLSPASAGLAVAIDTAAPDAPTGLVVAPADQGSGPTQTDDTQPTFRISLPANAVAGDVVTLEIDTVDDAAAALDASDITAGFVDIQSTNILADDTLYDISAFIADAAGNQGSSNASVEVEVGDASGAAIPAVVYDGVQGYLKHSGGLAGDADGQVREIVWTGKRSSDNSLQTIRCNVNGSGTVFELVIQTDNTVACRAWQADAATAVFSCVTTETLTAADGFAAIFVSVRGTHCALTLLKFTGAFAGTNTPGTLGDIDWTSDLFIGQDGSGGAFADHSQMLLYEHNIYLGGAGDAEWRKQFIDPGTMTPRDLGATGAIPLGSQIQSLMCHNSSAASHAMNKGSGGDADNASVFVDDTSPGVYEIALVNAFDLLFNAVGWWSADHAGNDIQSSAFASWVDRTANGNDLVQATVGNRPAVGSGGGLTWADFDGSDDILSCSTATAPLMNNFNAGGTEVTVFRPDTAGEGGLGRIWAKTNSGGTEVELTHVEDGAGAVGLLVDWYMSYTPTLGRHRTTDRGAFGTIRVSSARVNKTGGDSDLSVLFDAATLTVGSGLDVMQAESGAPTDLTGGGFHLGNRPDTTRSYDGRMYESAAWDVELSDPERERVMMHLGRKYGITVS